MSTYIKDPVGGDYSGFASDSNPSYILDGVQVTVAGRFTRVDATHYRLDAYAQYNHLIIGAGIILDTNDFVLDCRRVTINGTINEKGGDAVDENGGLGAGNGAAQVNGTNGGVGGDSAPFEAGAAAEAGVNKIGGKSGGQGGSNQAAQAGGGGGAGEDDAVAAPTFPTDEELASRTFFRDDLEGWLFNLINNIPEICLAGGGGGGAGSGRQGAGGDNFGFGGIGGGGGGAPRVIAIIAAIVDGSGTLDVRGGEGGPGAVGTNGTDESGGGGGGGGGGGAGRGWINVIARAFMFTGSILYTGGGGGAGGGKGAPGVNGIDDAVAGTNGDDGDTGYYDLWLI